MVLICVLLLVAGGWVAIAAVGRSNPTLELTGGVLLVSGLVLLGYQLHRFLAE